MCGIVGVAGDITAKEKKIFTELLIIDSLRGIDSTGMISVGSDLETVKYYKDIGDPFQFIYDERFDDAMKGQPKVLIGHNRFATSGNPNSSKNAHPFDFDNVIGVHNGTLKGQHRLPDFRKFEVDSENIYHSFNKDGVEKTVPKLEGAYALVWWDKVNKNLNILRNEQRPLFLAFNPTHRCMFWASEHDMLRLVFKRNNITPENQQYYHFKTNNWYRYSISKNCTNKIQQSNLVEIKGYQDDPLHYYSGDFYGEHYNYGAINRRSHRQRSPTPPKLTYQDKKKEAAQQLALLGKTEKKEVAAKEEKEEKSNVKIVSVVGYNGEKLTRKQFDKLTMQGCGWCSQDAIFEEADKIMWLSRNTFLCEDCHGDENNLELIFSGSLLVN